MSLEYKNNQRVYLKFLDGHPEAYEHILSRNLIESVFQVQYSRLLSSMSTEKNE